MAVKPIGLTRYQHSILRKVSLENLKLGSGWFLRSGRGVYAAPWWRETQTNAEIARAIANELGIGVDYETV